MRRISTVLAVAGLVCLTTLLPAQTLAQGTTADISVTTSYPSQVIGIGEKPSFELKVRSKGSARTVNLSVQQLPAGWTALFRGGGFVVEAAYVEPDEIGVVSLRVDLTDDVKAGTYRFLVVGASEGQRTELPLDVIIKDKLPPKLTLQVDLPTLKANPNTALSYSATLKNEGERDLTVNLVAEAPPGFRVTFRLTGQDVTSVPLEAGGSKYLTIEANPYLDIQAGKYAIKIRAQGESTETSADLTAEITGEINLTITSPDGRLSGRAYAGRDTPLKVDIQNNGSAPARAVELSSSEADGWSVKFEPQRIDEISAGKQQEVTMTVRPSEKALAGDYVITVRATAEDSASKSEDFRITVLTSTLWGIVGVALIAVAVGVVALAVMRFGRR
jgi:uncharacterized membrane protein